MALQTPKRAHLYWAKVPYLPERPLDILHSKSSRGEVRAALTFKTRPVLVVQNQQDNASAAYRFVLIAAVHSIKPGELKKLKRINHPTDFLLSPAECGLKRDSVVFLNQLMTIDKKLLQNRIGTLPAPKIAELNARLAIALGLVTLP